MRQMKKAAFLVKISIAIFVLSIFIIGCASVPKTEVSSASESFRNKYTLDKVVVLSRHNMRSPLSDGSSVLSQVTPHQWFNWTSRASELSLKGGVLETIMGQYFRKWLESEDFIPENYIPKDGEVRFYSNSMQRTIATAQYFSSGMLPVANVTIEHLYAPSRMDDVFNPQTVTLSDDFINKAMEEVNSMYGYSSLSELCETLRSSYDVLERVLDFEKSAYAQANNFPHFRNDDTEVFFKERSEPGMRGSLRIATSASDALVLQYYEETDDKKAAFGHNISLEEWEKIALIKDVFVDVLYTPPVVAKELARPLLILISDELEDENRKFSFLCGHESNIASVLSALDVKEYTLPDAIEKKIPIGTKLVFEVWKDNSGAEFVSINLVYQTIEQLRSCRMLSLEDPPAKYGVSLNGLNMNEDGLYPLDKLLEHFAKSAE